MSPSKASARMTPTAAPEPTPAVERAAVAWSTAYQKAVREAPSNRQGITRTDAKKAYETAIHAALTAALDVEEMARAMRDAECTGRDHGTSACPDRHCRDDVALGRYRTLAAALRTHLLGGAS